MKAISLYQPWATLVAIGAKQFETRSWSTSYRGPLAIHAAKKNTIDQRELAGMDPFRLALLNGGYKFGVDLPLGEFVALAELVDVLPTDDVINSISEEEYLFGNYNKGRFAWKLENIRPLLPTKPWPGKQRLWTLSDKLIEVLHERVKVEDQKCKVQTLSANFGARTVVEFNDRMHDRPGLWVIVEHKAGRGKVPLHVSYQACLSEMPKTSSPLAFPIGHGSNSRAFIVDLGEITNLLIGGSQGGGKSNILNVILSTFIKRNSPNELRLFLADFKRVEFSFYKGIPHLGGDVPYLQSVTLDKDGNEKPGPIRTVTADHKPKEGQEHHKPLGGQIITEGAQLVKILEYALSEIDRRTLLLEKNLVKKISTWNKRYPHKKLSRWVIVVDELGDVMLQPSLKKKIEPMLVRIAQLGRAMGVHIILATQTPKNEIVTLLLQNNIINRVVFRCGTGQASGVMLDGLYDAARLIPNPGRCIFREGAQLIEIQTPEITDLTVREAVKAAKSGKLDQETIEKKRTVAPDKIFEYALKELDGYCAVDDLYRHFQAQRVPRSEIMEILKEYEVRGAPPALEPEIEIGDDLYYLAPSPGGRNPRALIPEKKFISDFDKKWAAVLAFRVPQPAKNTETVNGHDSEISKTDEPDEPQEVLEVIASEDLAEELENERFEELWSTPDEPAAVEGLEPDEPPAPTVKRTNSKPAEPIYADDLPDWLRD